MDFNKIIDNFKKNSLVVTLICYSIGFLYYVTYYSIFDIPIIYYVSLEDILLYPLKILLIIFLYYLFFELVFHDLLGSKLQKIYKKRNLTVDEAYARFCDKIMSVSLLFAYFFYEIFLFKFDTGILIYFLAPQVVSYLAKKRLGHNAFNSKKSLIFLVLGILLFSFFSYLSVVRGNHKIGVTFETAETGKVDTRNGIEFYYIGETSSYIFVYNDSLAYTIVYSKATIFNLKYWGFFENKNEKKYLLPHGKRSNDRG